MQTVHGTNKLIRTVLLSLSLCIVMVIGLGTLAACTLIAEEATPPAQIATPAATPDPAQQAATATPIEDVENADEGDLAADIVVQFDDTTTVIRSIQFTEPISGLRALELSGLDLTLAETDWGAAVCAIEGVGCPADDCFCGGDFFWGYNFWDGDTWQGYPVGATGSVITQTGAVEGWRWGEFGASAVPAPQVQAAQAGLSWLQARQNSTDGSYGGSVSGGLDVLLALGANHIPGDTWRAAEDSPSLLDFTLQYGAEYAQGSASEAGKLALGLSAAQGCYPTGAPTPASYYNEELGAMAAEAGPLALAILGALTFDTTADTAANRNAHDAALAASVQALVEMAQPTGGWEWFPGWGVDTNSTALALQALLAAGEDVSSPVITAALEYLRDAQNDDGGFPYDPASEISTDSDTNSTAYAVQALIAAGEDLTRDAWQPQGESPYDFLLSMQLDGGGFMWQATVQEANQLATEQAIPALLGRSLPIHTGNLELCTADVASTALFVPAVVSQ